MFGRREGTRRLASVRVAVVAVLLAAVFVPVGASAAPRSLKCGETVTESVTLTANLTNCHGDGLIAGARGITINLGGHTISGTGSGSGVVGIGLETVTIENGTVTGFEYGIMAIDGNVTIHGIAATSNEEDGIQAEGVTVSITDSTANDNQLLGIFTFETGRLNITDSTANGNTVMGMLVAADKNSIAGSTANDNNRDGIFSLAEETLSITGSTANGNKEDGIVGIVNNCGNCSPVGKTLSVASSTANGNGGNGIVATFILEEPYQGALDATAKAVSVASSRANGNGGDGILIPEGEAMLTKTTTNGNGGHGIEAPSGSTASGAKASGNKTPLQCVNVMCI
jgi:hypothetical protein